MSLNKLTFVLLALVSLFLLCNSEIEIKPDIKSMLADSFLKNALQTSNLSHAAESVHNLKQELKNLQEKIVQSRNNKCIFEAHRDFDYASVKYSKFFDLDRLNRSFSYENFTLLSDLYANQFQTSCISSDSLVELIEILNSKENRHGDENDSKILNRILFGQFVNEGCDFCEKTTLPEKKITSFETWLYGILFVTLISSASLLGAFVIPFSKKKIYKKILMFLMGLAVGSLAGSGFLHLIPEAYGLTEDIHYSKNHAYVWKGVVMMAGVYLFYLVEILLKLMILRRKHVKKKHSSNQNSSTKNKESIVENSELFESIGFLKTTESVPDPNVELRVRLTEHNLANVVEENSKSENNAHGHSHGFGNLQSVAPVAWMIIFGDGLHNFIDGLSIGAAFTESILKGISICLAVMCEEFPHELGDFAILLNSGMSYPVALLFNFLSACCCFAGLAVGITLGENLKVNEWIYSIAGGMFIYISLCGMIPELYEIGEEIEKDYLEELNGKKMLENSSSNPPSNHEPVEFDLKTKLKIIFIQNLGIVSGFLFMLVMAFVADNIQLSQ